MALLAAVQYAVPQRLYIGGTFIMPHHPTCLSDDRRPFFSKNARSGVFGSAAGPHPGELEGAVPAPMSLEEFARVCFPHACRLPFSPLHRYLFDRRAAKTSLPLEARTGVIDVVLAPRGAAKSTLVSCIFPLHALLHGGEHYIVLISATLRQAQRRIAAMRAALRPGGSLANRFARADDGEPLVRHATTTAIEVREARIEVFGAGAEMRGISHGPWRPTWIILDDVERGDRTLVARHRDAMADWFHEVVENLGDRYTNIDLIGTLLHPDALPARLAERPDVVARTFPLDHQRGYGPDALGPLARAVS